MKNRITYIVAKLMLIFGLISCNPLSSDDLIIATGAGKNSPVNAPSSPSSIVLWITSGAPISSPTFSWTNPTSNFDFIEVALGTSADVDEDDIVNWTSVEGVSEYSFEDLDIEECTLYYPKVRAAKSLGAKSEALVFEPGFQWDKTNPLAPVSVITSAYDSSLTEAVTTTWTQATDNCEVDHYELAIGTTSGATDVVSWTDIGKILSYQAVNGVDGLSISLSPSATYYTSIKTVDAARNVSSVTTGASWQIPGYLSCKDALDQGNITDGIYYLDLDGQGGNPSFQVYCDMTTDGGGWTLIGRGREDWAWNNSGLNTSSVYLNVGTTNAFTPAYLPATTIDNLIGANVKDLVDGMRIKRAANVAGTNYQELRWNFTTQTTWSWLFDTSFAIASATWEISDLGAAGSTGAANTFDMIPGNDHSRLFTWAWGGHANKKGFSYGSNVSAGTNSATNFLWEDSTESHSIPYTEVYIRE